RPCPQVLAGSRCTSKSRNNLFLICVVAHHASEPAHFSGNTTRASPIHAAALTGESSHILKPLVIFDTTLLMAGYCNYARFALILPYHLSQRIEQGAIVEELTHMMRARRLDIFQDLRDDQMYSFLRQSLVKRAYRRGRRVVHVVHRRSIDAKPA